MRLTNYLLAIAVIASATFAVNAEQISIDAAMRSAQRHLVNNKSLKSNRASESLNLVYTAPNIYNEDESAYYVFNRKNGGFVIVGADDCATTILATVDEGSFDINNLPDNFKWWMENSQEQISEAILNGDIDAEPSDIALAETQASTGRQSIQPLISTKWDQGAPYNKYCTTTSGESAVGGCVAVALAQIVNYHQWPKTALNGDYNLGFWKFSFTDLTFDWDNMASTISESSPVEQIDAVSTLIRNCGIMIGTNYGTMLTTANEANILRVLHKCFDYSKSLSIRNRDYYRTSEWEDIIINELANNRPVLYAGGEGTRHAFVCDGYNAEDNTFHMNWGWGGSCNGFFSINALKLNDESGNPFYNFHGRENILINMMPSTFGNKQDTPIFCSGNALDCYYYSKMACLSIRTEGRFTSLADYCYGSTTSDYDTYVKTAYKVIDVETKEERFFTASNISAAGNSSESNRYGGIGLKLDNYLERGKSYDIIPYYMEPDAEDWKPVIFKYNATKVWRVTRAEDGTYSGESAMTPAKLNITAMRSYNAVTGADFTVDADIENEGDANYLGTLKIALVDAEGNTAMSMSKEIDVPGNSSQTVTLMGSLVDVSKGNYSLVASDSSSNQVSDGYTVTVASNVFTGIDDVEASKFAIGVSNSEITIKASTEVNSVEVYNIAGQKVYSENIGANSANISIANFTQGVYVVKVFANGEVAVKQFVKK